jgi:hypothetical protein
MTKWQVRMSIKAFNVLIVEVIVEIVIIIVVVVQPSALPAED